MREVDEAVRTDDVTTALRKYGLTVGIVLLLALAAFGGYLYWSASQEQTLESQSEIIIKAMDELQAGNLEQADQELATVDESLSPAAMASANMLRAGIALQQNRVDDAVGFYQRVINNEAVPQPMRDASLVRMVSANYDNMDPQAVIDQLAPLANADSAWFGSAGELVANAYLDQNKPEQAGPLLVELSKNEDVPGTIRARSRQLAGHYGFDAIDDVEETLGEAVVEDNGGSAPTAQ